MNAATNQPSILTLRLGQSDQAGHRGKAITDIKKTWASVTNSAHIENARIHDLRHTFASIGVSQGQSLPIIGAMLGHTQAQTTARYAHLYDSALQLAAEAVATKLNQRDSKCE